MRLIDADKLYDDMRDEYRDGNYCDCCLTSTFNIIDFAPTIYPESLRPKGEWINERMLVGGSAEKRGADCSNCGSTIEEPYDRSNFCPNCGADMR